MLSVSFQVPQQDNGYDCGVYVLLFFTEFLQRKVTLERVSSEIILHKFATLLAIKQQTRMRLNYICFSSMISNFLLKNWVFCVIVFFSFFELKQVNGIGKEVKISFRSINFYVL